MDEDDFFDVVGSENPNFSNSERMRRIHPVYLKYWDEYIRGVVFHDFNLYCKYMTYNDCYNSYKGMAPEDEKSIKFLEQKFLKLKEMEI